MRGRSLFAIILLIAMTAFAFPMMAGELPGIDADAAQPAFNSLPQLSTEDLQTLQRLSPSTLMLLPSDILQQLSSETLAQLPPEFLKEQSEELVRKLPVELQKRVQALLQMEFKDQFASVTTDSGRLNIRKEPKANSASLAKLNKGTVLLVDGYTEDDLWAHVQYKDVSGYVKKEFLEFVEEPQLPTAIASDEVGIPVLELKQELKALGYLKTEEVNSKYDDALRTALVKVQLMNDMPLSTEVVTAELLKRLELGMICKYRSGYLMTEADQQTGLTVAVFVWDVSGQLYEMEESVNVKIGYGVQATGGLAPYTIKVYKSLSDSGVDRADAVDGDTFNQVWNKQTDRLYVYATVTDALGNTVTAVAPYKYTLPERYTDGKMG